MFTLPFPTHILVTQVMNVPERDTSEDQQFSKVPEVSLANSQGALIHQNRDTEHQAMVGTTVLINSTIISLVSQL